MLLASPLREAITNVLRIVPQIEMMNKLLRRLIESAQIQFVVLCVEPNPGLALLVGIMPRNVSFWYHFDFLMSCTSEYLVVCLFKFVLVSAALITRCIPTIAVT